MSTRQFFFFFFFFLDVLLPAFLWMLDKALSSSFPPPLPHQKQRPVMNDFEAKPVASTLFGNLLYSSTFSYFLRFGRNARKDVDKCLAIIQQQQLGQCQSVSYLYSFSTLQCFAGVFLPRERESAPAYSYITTRRINTSLNVWYVVPFLQHSPQVHLYIYNNIRKTKHFFFVFCSPVAWGAVTE